MNRKIKLLLLADPSSSHTSKWVNSLHKFGMNVSLFGLSAYNSNEYDVDIKIFTVDFSKSAKSKSDGDFRKLVYLKAIFELKKVINSFQPDIIHCHYASSYGLIGVLSGFKPIFTSVWGNDIYDFPKKSFIHKQVIKFVLNKSEKIFSTSKIMAEEISIYTRKAIKVIPFGIDINLFKPFEVKNFFEPDTLVLGAVKSLSFKYGNDTVIKAFKIVKEKLPNYKLKLLLVGDGILRTKLEKLVTDLNLSQDVIFVGLIPHSQIPLYHNMIDIHIYPSVWESFGVSNLEAAACEKVQVASNIGGFNEILNDGTDSFLVNPDILEEFAEKIILLIKDENLRIKMGKQARQHVIQNYNWENNVLTMIEEYKSFLENCK